MLRACKREKAPIPLAAGTRRVSNPRWRRIMTSDNTVTGTLREAFLNKSALQIRHLGRRAAQDIVEIGRLLTACKTMLNHGEWGPWTERQFGWSDRTARNFMNVHRMFSSKSEIISDLNIDAT